MYNILYTQGKSFDETPDDKKQFGIQYIYLINFPCSGQMHLISPFHFLTQNGVETKFYAALRR